MRTPANHELPPRRFDEHDAPSAAGDVARLAGSFLPIACQLVGLILVVIGGYFALQLASDLLQYLRNPGDWEQAIAGMAKTLDLGDLTVAVEGRRVVVDRPVALLALLVGYFVCTWIAMRLMIGGAKLMAVFLAHRNVQRSLSERGRRDNL